MTFKFSCRDLPFTTVAMVCFLVPVASAQNSTQNRASNGPIIIGEVGGIDGYDCDTTKANFDLIVERADKEKSIIAIARLGRKESSRAIARRRLRNFREFLHLTRGIPNEKIVTAIGEPGQGFGQVDIYVNGKLFIVFYLKHNRDFFTNCEP